LRKLGAHRRSMLAKGRNPAGLPLLWLEFMVTMVELFSPHISPDLRGGS